MLYIYSSLTYICVILFFVTNDLKASSLREEQAKYDSTFILDGIIHLSLILPGSGDAT